MTIGVALFLIAVGAILRYAVTAHVAGIDIQTVGLILLVIGIIGFVFSLLWTFFGPARRRAAYVQEPAPGAYVQEPAPPAYVQEPAPRAYADDPAYRSREPL